MSNPRHSEEFKEEAVRQVLDRGYSVSDVSALIREVRSLPQELRRSLTWDCLVGVVTVELGFATSEYNYYMEDGTTLLKSYKDNLNKSATLGLVYSF
jgi:hypothetical protein